ncbi:aldehyde dehydrogenase family protein, partial [Streptomyces lasiicapitis]|uniref:aldehyde dehydrogenase family protein n=1 Tax=Streptomyces lasiicapitis TaxID=1923961 RepID=UPI003693287C
MAELNRGTAERPTVSRNPADLRDVVTEQVLSDADGLTAAARAAHRAQSAWAETPAPLRGRVAQNVGRLVAENKEALAALITREVGKPYGEALGEVQEVIDTCDFFLGEGRRLYGQTVPSEMPDKQLFTYRKPLGTAVIITAANFPAAVPAWYLVPALLCGNTVVWKPSESAMAVAEALFRLFRAGGVPEDVLRLVHADGETTYAGLERALTEGLVQKIGFTGSTAAGRRVSELAGRHLQSPCLELGGKNPLVVTDDADLELAVQGAGFRGFATAGPRGSLRGGGVGPPPGGACLYHPG